MAGEDQPYNMWFWVTLVIVLLIFLILAYIESKGRGLIEPKLYESRNVETKGFQGNTIQIDSLENYNAENAFESGNKITTTLT